ncbi:5-formyltetrahydrofolate cyclo-ligase [Paeniglutamicibacter sp. NPDC012692]|uniref:5-formyltetrahydrofolate cyclo-ligase n=1 Tax=Paeniglutamicibacter sp. NPDC012692 TaxID=3364388 RepID=UPI0036C328AC
MNEHDPKDEIRTLLRAKRRALGDAERDAQMGLLLGHLLPWLAEHAPRKTLTCFLSYGTEPPTGLLLEQLDAAGYTVYVPVCEPERRLSWVRWFPGVEMARSAVAPIDEPVGQRFSADLMDQVDVVLVPAQAVDEHGDRLGQGGGYYDRFIASMAGLGRVPKLLAMVFEHELVAAGSFPVDPFDQRVDAVATASGVRNLTV